MTNNSVALHNLENETIKFYDEEQKNIFEISEWLEGDELFGPWPFAPFVQNGKIYSFPMVINLTGWTGGDWLADIACMHAKTGLLEQTPASTSHIYIRKTK